MLGARPERGCIGAAMVGAAVIVGICWLSCGSPDGRLSGARWVAPWASRIAGAGMGAVCASALRGAAAP